jgi:DNA helicase II / ATP-dependent DNA helicase PcrA
MEGMEEIRLNPAQKKAVTHKEGPLLIIAGAGTGKTRVITQRIRWLVEKEHARSTEILALTFTQKAAQEMEERVDVAMPYGYEPMQISTFHSFCDSILKQEAIYIGLDPNYTLMSQAQEYVFFRSKLFDLSLDRFRPHGNPTKFIGDMLSHFSRLQDEDVSPDDYDDFIKRTRSITKEERLDLKELAKVFREYSELKEKESVLSFADLVPLALRLFRERESVLKRYRKQYRYILVDEFQDTNYAQNELVALLAGENGNITVVGDDDQSIYKFRGAAISNILDFKKTFPGYTKVVLTKNYRSDQEILDAAYELIKHNDPYRLEVTEGIDKRLVSARLIEEGPPPVTDAAPIPQMSILGGEGSDKSGTGKITGNDPAILRIHEINDVAEAEGIAKEIARIVKEEKIYGFRDCAVLARAHNHVDEIVRSFHYHGIPFRFLGGRGLYTRPEVKDLIAYLRILVDYTDDISMYRLVNLRSGGMEPREFVDLQRISRRNKISMFELLEKMMGRKVGVLKKVEDREEEGGADSDGFIAQGSLPSKELEEDTAPRKEKFPKLDELVSATSAEWLMLLFDLLEDSFSQMKAGKSVGTILYDFVDKSGYIEALTSDESEENEWKVKNISAYFDSLKRFESENETAGVHEYMDYLEYSLEIGESPQVDEAQIVEFDGVNISTIHGAKGLEFPVVFLVNMVNERFPTRRRSEVLPIPEGLIKEHLPEGDEHIQEERRLCYVGMTRAMDRLYLTSADYYAQGIRRKKQSLFLQDIGKIEEPAVDTRAGSKKDLAREVVTEGDMDIVIPDDVKKQFVAKIERHLSYSQLSSFENCPYQFYFKYVLGIPGLPSASKSFGLTVHNTLRAFYERVMRAQKGFEGFEKVPDLEDLLELYEEKWQGEGYENRAQENKRFVSGKKALMAYYEDYYSEKERPVLLEGRFRVDVGDVRLAGVIDRMDKTPKGHEIIDYKTGNVPKDRKIVERDLQVPIYVLAAEQMGYTPVTCASYLYLLQGEKIQIPVSDEMKEKAAASVKDTVNEIRKMKFPPKPGMLCSFCDYRTICDYAML